MKQIRAIDALLAAAVTAIVFARGFGLYPWYDDWLYMSAAGDAIARQAPGEFIWSVFTPHRRRGRSHRRRPSGAGRRGPAPIIHGDEGSRGAHDSTCATGGRGAMRRACSR